MTIGQFMDDDPVQIGGRSMPCGQHSVAAVLVGNFSEGYRVVGPFPTWDDAAMWADRCAAGSNSWVVNMEMPTEDGEAPEAPVLGGRS